MTKKKHCSCIIGDNQQCHHSYFGTYKEKDYCIFHYPDIEGKKDEQTKIKYDKSKKNFCR